MKKTLFLLIALSVLSCNDDESRGTDYPITFKYKDYSLGKLRVFVVKTTDYQYSEVFPTWLTDTQAEANDFIADAIENDISETPKNLSFTFLNESDVNVIIGSGSVSLKYTQTNDVFTIKDETDIPAFDMFWDKTNKTANIPWRLFGAYKLSTKKWTVPSLNPSSVGLGQNTDAEIKDLMKSQKLGVSDTLIYESVPFRYNQE